MQIVETNFRFVLPAQAGVILKLLKCKYRETCAPRAGGGDPMITIFIIRIAKCSPRRRG